MRTFLVVNISNWGHISELENSEPIWNLLELMAHLMPLTFSSTASAILTGFLETQTLRSALLCWVYIEGDQCQCWRKVYIIRTQSQGHPGQIGQVLWQTDRPQSRIRVSQYSQKKPSRCLTDDITSAGTVKITLMTKLRLRNMNTSTNRLEMKLEKKSVKW